MGGDYRALLTDSGEVRLVFVSYGVPIITLLRESREHAGLFCVSSTGAVILEVGSTACWQRGTPCIS